LFRDGLSIGTDSYSQKAIGGNVTLGSDYGAAIGTGLESFDGDIAEALIYNRALSPSEIAQMNDYLRAKWLPGSLARAPRPADGATDVCRKAVLSWEPTAGAPPANGHRVFFSSDSSEVEGGSAGANQGLTSDPEFDTAALPFALGYETTYYWRIDEANIVTGWDEGSVWQFTTEPLGYQMPNSSISARADSSEPGQGPENTINDSGLSDDLHSKEPEAMWISALGATQPNWIEYEFDKVYRLHKMWVWNHNTTLENTIGMGVKNATIEYSTDGENYTPLGPTHEFARAPGADGYAHNTEIDLEGVAARYVRITAASNWGGIFDQHGLSEVRFFYVPVRARDLYPEDEATVAVDVTLTWRGGREGVTNEVYLSTDAQAVANGSVSPAMLLSSTCESSYGPLSLDMGTTYYWKVSEVNNAGQPNAWHSDVLSFTTIDSRIVDNMDSYGDADTPGDPGGRIWYTWKDGQGWTDPAPGYSGNRSGSVVDRGTDPTLGGSALMYYYDNDGTNFFGTSGMKFYSEATATVADLPISTDWTIGGAKALSLWFYGDADNVAGPLDQMYMKLNGVKVPYDGAMTDVQESGWHEWLLDLASLGIDLSNVTSISIGFGDESNTTTPGASGLVIFDEIRLYPSRCILARRSEAFAGVDYIEDCVVDYRELEAMAGEWLGGGDVNPHLFPYQWVFERHSDNPVLSAVPGTWEATWFTVDSLIQTDGPLNMYYSASDVGNLNVKLGLAYSDDGIAWQRYSSDPIWENAWDHFLRDVRVYQFGDSDFWLYYSDGDEHIDLAFSNDGINWQNYEHNPILEVSQSWEYHVMQERVMKISENQWFMWYSTYAGGKPRVTGVATSEDGIHWSKYEDNPVLTLGEDGEWDDYSAFQPLVFHQDDYFHMIYTGSSTTNSTGYRLGYALSKDGILWTKSPDNPIFVPGSGGAWDAGKVSCPTLVRTGPNTFNIYYAGATASGATYLGIGLAQAQLNSIATNLNTDDITNFKDLAILAELWLESQMWP